MDTSTHGKQTQNKEDNQLESIFVNQSFGDYSFVPGDTKQSKLGSVYIGYYSTEENLETFHYDITVYITETNSTQRAKQSFNEQNKEYLAISDLKDEKMVLGVNTIKVYPYEKKLGTEEKGLLSSVAATWTSEKYIIVINKNVQKPTRDALQVLSEKDMHSILERYLDKYAP